jgi:hypothetical protein
MRRLLDRADQRIGHFLLTDAGFQARDAGTIGKSSEAADDMEPDGAELPGPVRFADTTRRLLRAFCESWDRSGAGLATRGAC